MHNTSIIQKIHINWKAGVTVGLVSLPLAISLAVAAGTTPVAGVLTAIWAGLIASLFGGSNYNIVGPTGALAGLLIVYSKVFGVESLPMLALLSGLFILLAYLFRLEKYLIFIPGSALHGFILGVSTIIVLNQIEAIFNIPNLPKTGHLLNDVYTIFFHVSNLHWPTFLLFLGSLSLLIICSYIFSTIPGTIIVAPLGILFGYLCSSTILPWQIQTLATKFGSFQATLFDIPSFTIHISYLFPAISIAAISILETLISAKIADGTTKTKHDRQKEVLGLGFANIASGFFGGIPATAALARTALNIKSGCTHKISAAISSITIAIISLFLLSYFQYLPLAVIAAILVFVSAGMLETEHFWYMYRIDKTNLIIVLVVAFLTVYEDAMIGILFGSVVAMLLFMQKLSAGYHEIMEKEHHAALTREKDATQKETVFVYIIKGPFAYINAQAHLARLETIDSSYTDVILKLRDMHFIDLDGVEALGEIIQMLQNKGTRVWICGLNSVIEQMLHENKYFRQLVQTNHIYPNANAALAAIAKTPR